MTKKEIIEICLDYIQDGASIDEVFEWVEENTNLDPTEIINEIYKKEVFI